MFKLPLQYPTLHHNVSFNHLISSSHTCIVLSYKVSKNDVGISTNWSQDPSLAKDYNSLDCETGFIEVAWDLHT